MQVKHNFFRKLTTANRTLWDCGRKVGPATPRRPGLEVRMYDRETVELALYTLEEGMTQREAAELCGDSRASVGFWAAGRVPHERGAGRCIWQ